MKARSKELKINQRIRINKSGCLDRCELGPVMVIYPEGAWYHYQSREDIDEILDMHVIQGRPVERLLLKPGQKIMDPEVSERIELKISQVDEYLHDVSRYDSQMAAIKQGRKLAAAGAAILDVGGESTRPGARFVPIDVELTRIIPVIKTLAEDGFTISVDTRKPEVMKQAVAVGANMINDVTALRHKPQSLKVAAALDVPVVLMHSRGSPSEMQRLMNYEDVVIDVYNDLAERVKACVTAGIPRERLILDPGIGFAKDAEQSVQLLANLDKMHGLGLPIMIGASRKSFIGLTAQAPNSNDRLPGSIAAALWATQKGAAILRVHDVIETVQALAVHKALIIKDSNSKAAE